MFKSSVAVISSFLLLSPSALALNYLTNTENNHPNHPVLLNQHKLNPSQIAQIDDLDVRESILTFVKEITVKITTNDNRGSGTLIAKKQGNTYLVLTNAHVIGKGKTITIQTHDGKTHQASLVNNPLPQDYDLALLEFTSEQNYTVPESGDINIPTETTAVFSGGYVAETGEFKTTEGKITHNLSQSFKEGYSIGYSNPIQQGMSGGPIVDQGRLLVGINGRSAAPILNTGYIYSNGQTPTAAEIQEYRKVSWGIPINTLLTYIEQAILTAYGLPLPQAVARVENPSYGGYIGELEAKARKFVVRIDSSSKANGSGVIIAKEGNSYTVLTADHVLCEKPIQGVLEQPCFADYRYTITTHDGKTIPLDKSTIIRQEGVDLAVFKFESQENYSVAEIADYNPNTNDFVFAAGFPKIGNNDPQWMFSGGRVNDKEQGLLQTRQNDLQTQKSGNLKSVSASLTGGYELVYTSITYGGMSGGAILDANGRLIGIHGRSEGAGRSGIQLGYSLGIPISTFVGLQERLKAKPQFLTTAKPQVSQQQEQEIIKAIVAIKVPNTKATANIWIERGGQLWRLGKSEEAVKAFDEAIKQNNPENVYLAWYGKGLALGDLGRYQTAIEALEKAILTLPPQSSGDYSAEFHSSILQQQSVVYRYLPDYEKELTAINKAITLSPNNPNFYNEKYVVLSELKRYDEALEAINQGIKLAPRAVWYFNRGNLYYNLQKWDLAASDFTKAIEINPKFADAYNNRGLLYIDLQKWDLAASDYNQAIEINPKYANAYNNRGNLYYNLQKWDLAASDYTKAIEINPKLAETYNNRGVLYSDLQKWDLAASDFTKAIEINPKLAETYNNRGNLYKDLQKWDLAASDYNQAIEINPKYANVYNNRGLLYSNLQKWDLAASDYTKAIEINPKLADAYNNRGIVYYNQQKWDLAASDFTKAIEINPKDDFAYYNRGILYKDQQKWDLAASDFTKALEINPKLADAYNNRGLVYKNQQKWDLAASDYTKALEINPKYAKAYINRGLLYSDLQKWDLAASDFTKAIEINPKYAEAYYNRGLLYDNLQKWDLAASDYTKALEINPKYAKAYINRGVLYADQKKWDLAASDFTKALEINPKYAEAYYNRGLLYDNLQKWDLAASDYTKAIEINPKYAEAYNNRGNLYKNQQKWDLAASDFTKAIEINPKYALAYMNRGILYSNLQKWDLAASDFTKAIEINPKYALAYYNRGILYYQLKQTEKAVIDLIKAAELFRQQGNMAAYEKVMQALQQIGG